MKGIIMFDDMFEKAAIMDGRIRQFVQGMSQEYDVEVFSNTFDALYSAYDMPQLDVERYTEQLIESGFVTICRDKETGELLFKPDKEKGEVY